jgi:CheY-like chemotaxis protein
MPNAMLVPSGRPQRRARVIVAEDDAELRHMVSSLLSADGYEVVEVVNGEELLDYIAGLTRAADGSVEPDLIISDICMPEMDGLQVLKRLRNAHVATPVVLMTAFANAAVCEQADRLGAITLLSKPFEIDDLRMIVLNVAAGSGRARAAC